MVIVHHGEDEHTKYHEPHDRLDGGHKEYGPPYEQAAYKAANDVDGYKGMVFCRWTAGAIGPAIKINWKNLCSHA